MNAPAPPTAPSMHGNIVPALREPLPTWVRRGLLGLVIVLHIVGGWALTQVNAARLIVGEVAPMEVRMVPAEQTPQVDPELPMPDEPLPLDLQPPEMPKLETQLETPPPDLPPPVFPVAAAPPPPPKLQPKVPPRPPIPVEAAPQQAPPAAPTAPRTVSASQVQYLEPPSPVYPARSKRAGEKGSVVVRVFVDIAGRATQVSLQTSSRFPALDEAALVAVRNARFRPFMEAGVAQPVWVLIPINFVLE